MATLHFFGSRKRCQPIRQGGLPLGIAVVKYLLRA
jgi:hypothetical protein